MQSGYTIVYPFGGVAQAAKINGQQPRTFIGSSVAPDCSGPVSIYLSAPFGLRDEGLLESALARAENYYAYGEVDLFLLAAAYVKGIARNHPLIDGKWRR
jgi:hypothetical protein